MVDRLSLSRAILFVHLAAWLSMLAVMLAMFVDITTCNVNSVGRRVAAIVCFVVFSAANAHAARALFACAPFRLVLSGNAAVDPGATPLLRSVYAVGTERWVFFCPFRLCSHHGPLFLVFSAVAAYLCSNGRFLEARTDVSSVLWPALLLRYGFLLAHSIWVVREADMLDDATHGAVSAIVRRQWRAFDAELQFPQSFALELIDAARCHALLCAEFCSEPESPVVSNKLPPVGSEPALSHDDAREPLMAGLSVRSGNHSLGQPEGEAAAGELCTVWDLRQLHDLRFLRSFPRFSWPSFAARFLRHLRLTPRVVTSTSMHLFNAHYRQTGLPEQFVDRRTARLYAWSLVAMFLIRLPLGVLFLVSGVNGTHV
jgi:hypothetical protein